MFRSTKTVFVSIKLCKRAMFAYIYLKIYICLLLVMVLPSVYCLLPTETQNIALKLSCPYIMMYLSDFILSTIICMKNDSLKCFIIKTHHEDKRQKVYIPLYRKLNKPKLKPKLTKVPPLIVTSASLIHIALKRIIRNWPLPGELRSQNIPKLMEAIKVCCES